jgi:hypothetical protein
MKGMSLRSPFRSMFVVAVLVVALAGFGSEAQAWRGGGGFRGAAALAAAASAAAEATQRAPGAARWPKVPGEAAMLRHPGEARPIGAPMAARLPGVREGEPLIVRVIPPAGPTTGT